MQATSAGGHSSHHPPTTDPIHPMCSTTPTTSPGRASLHSVRRLLPIARPPTALAVIVAIAKACCNPLILRWEVHGVRLAWPWGR